MIVSKILVEDHARDVVLVQSLHDDHDHAFDRVVQTGRDGLKKRGHLGLALHFRTSRIHAVGIIDQHSIGTKTRQAGDRCGDSKAASLVHKVQFFVLILG